ncbi:MAG: hypothetical protein Q8881_02315 [Sweet potato little leaf phytoplasma]|nr:hypothetical protein [Sweet potato little leaf phytoplasma]
MKFNNKVVSKVKKSGEHPIKAQKDNFCLFHPFFSFFFVGVKGRGEKEGKEEEKRGRKRGQET